MAKTLVFDYDGTIHETLVVYEPVIREVVAELEEKGLICKGKRAELTQDMIAGWLGVNAKEMWQQFQPDFSDEQRDMASAMVGERIEQFIRDGRGRWYEGAEEVLDDLKAKGYSMVILSNSKIKTRDFHFDFFNMKRWFDRWYDCESYGWAPKTEIIQDIKRQYGDDLVVIGDRKADIDAAVAAAVASIGCLYGYGSEAELGEATVKINDIRELTDVKILNPKDVP